MSDRPRSRRRPAPKTAADRVRHLLETRWGGNQAQMARDVGCSQGAVSKIATGLVDPGKRLLHLVASVPGINPEWVLHGTGEPWGSRDPQPLRPTTFRLVESVADLQSGDLLGTVETPPTVGSETSYWLRLRSTDPIVARGQRSLRPGDLLLVETDRDRHDRLDETWNRLCVVRCVSPGATTLRLAAVSFEGGDEESGPGFLEADFFEPPNVPEGMVYETRRTFANGRWQETRSSYRERREADGRIRRIRGPAGRPPHPQIAPDDVVAVVVLALRPHP